MADNPIMEKNNLAALEKERPEQRKVDVDLEAPADFTSPDALYEELVRSIRRYHPSDDITMIEKAYHIADDAHKDQRRKSGEPYICLLYTSDAADEL